MTKKMSLICGFHSNKKDLQCRPSHLERILVALEAIRLIAKTTRIKKVIAKAVMSLRGIVLKNAEKGKEKELYNNQEGIRVEELKRWTGLATEVTH